MSVLVKICGLNSDEAVRAASRADFAGFIFYPPSPRYVTPRRAAHLARLLPKRVKPVAVLVNPDDALLDRVLRVFDAQLIQLHGKETPARVMAIKRRFARSVIKAVPIRTAKDFASAKAYQDVADWLMFDAKPPERPGALPGGNAVSFDWTLLARRKFETPWFLSGGLTPDNVAEAVRLTGAKAVDVSSGVEDQPGRKNTHKIKGFIAAARGL